MNAPLPHDWSEPYLLAKAALQRFHERALHGDDAGSRAAIAECAKQITLVIILTGQQ